MFYTINATLYIHFIYLLNRRTANSRGTCSVYACRGALHKLHIQMQMHTLIITTAIRWKSPIYYKYWKVHSRKLVNCPSHFFSHLMFVDDVRNKKLCLCRFMAMFWYFLVCFFLQPSTLLFKWICQIRFPMLHWDWCINIGHEQKKNQQIVRVEPYSSKYSANAWCSEETTLNVNVFKFNLLICHRVPKQCVLFFIVSSKKKMETCKQIIKCNALSPHRTNETVFTSLSN